MRLYVLLLSLLLACSPSSQQKAVQDTFAGLNVASAAFLAYDNQHQQSIVAAAPDKATGEKQLATYRVEQGKVQELLTVGYQTVAAAAIVVSQPNVDTMLTAALNLYNELKSIGVKLP